MKTLNLPQRLRERRGAQLLALLLAFTFVGLTGCKAPKHTDYNAFRYGQATVSNIDYKLAPPDVVLISSKRVPEIHDQMATIRTDGKITLPLLGDVDVAGHTPAEVSATLRQMSEEFYERPDVALQVLQFNSKKVYVFGEVSNAGSYTYDGANTVLETVASAQPTRLSDFQRIQVIRPARDGQPGKKFSFDLKHTLRTGDASRDAILEEGDIIYLPPNPLAAVGLAFQQLLLPLQPAAATVNTPMQLSTGFNSTSSAASRY